MEDISLSFNQATQEQQPEQWQQYHKWATLVDGPGLVCHISCAGP